MSFVDLLQSAQAQALEAKLDPSELSVYEYYCREYSKTFFTPLKQVYDLNVEFVIKNVYAEQLSDWAREERLEDLKDIIFSLSDPDYDQKKERAFREETKKILEEEKERLERNEPVHHSMAKKTSKKNTSEPKEALDSQLPMQGGLSSNLIKQLQHGENEG